MAYTNVLFEQEGAVAYLSVNRPDKRNALNMETRREIAAVLDAVDKNPDIMVLVLTGVGDKAFIAGTDLNEFGRMTPEQVYAFGNSYGQRLYTRLEDLSIPVIGMINGLCLGGGMEFAMCCDFRIAADSAKFGQPEISLGFIPSSGATQRLPRLVGPGRARQMIFTGEIISAEDAYRMGLVNKVVPLAELKDTVREIAAKMTDKGRVSLQMAKRAVLMSQEAGLHAGLSFETLAQMVCFHAPDREEGVNSFFEKRKPVFNKE